MSDRIKVLIAVSCIVVLSIVLTYLAVRPRAEDSGKPPVKVHPLTVYGPWEDERFRVESHSASGWNMEVTSVFDKVLQREVVVVGNLSKAAVITSVYDVPRPQQPQTPPSKPQEPAKAPETEKKP